MKDNIQKRLLKEPSEVALACNALAHRYRVIIHDILLDQPDYEMSEVDLVKAVKEIAPNTVESHLEVMQRFGNIKVYRREMPSRTRKGKRILKKYVKLLKRIEVYEVPLGI